MRSRTHRIRSHLLLVVAVLTLAMISACTPPPTPVEPTTDPTATPLFATDDEALAAAVQAFTDYESVENQILADGGAGEDRIEEVAVRDALDAALAGYAEYRQGGLRSIGTTTFDSMSLQQRLTEAGEADVVTTYVCMDFSQSDVLDSDNNSVVREGRKLRQAFVLSFDAKPSTADLVLASRDPWTGVDTCQAK